MATEIRGRTSSVEIFELFGQIFVYSNNFMLENFQKHLLKCWYCECCYNQNLALSSSPKMRGLLIAIFLYITNVWKTGVTSLSDMVRIYSSPEIDSLPSLKSTLQLTFKLMATVVVMVIIMKILITLLFTKISIQNKSDLNPN